MRLTPQPQVEYLDPLWLSARLAAVGVGVVDARQSTPVGEIEPWLKERLLPQLEGQDAQGGKVLSMDGGVALRCDLAGEQGPPLGVWLLARDSSAGPAELPAHTPASLERIAADLPRLAAAEGERRILQQQVEKLSGELSDTYEELSLGYTLGSSINVKCPAPQFLASACEPTIRLMEVCGIGICTWDPRLGDIPPMIFGKLSLGDERLLRLDGALRRLIETAGDDAFVLENQVRRHPLFAWIGDGARQLLAVPMRRHGQTVGCVFAIDKDVPPEVFGTFNRGVFTSIDRKLLAGVAVHVALFLENRRLFSDSESLMMGLLHSMVAAVDAKDTYTRGHSIRVATFARKLAEAAGSDEGFCDRVYLAGLLHDVGKIGIDDAVLRKPGRLTDEEFAQIQRHPEIGFRILTNVQQIQDLLPGVLHHHERFDGEGYPARIAGEAIPLLARILCIADSFDAMTSSRTYRSAMPPEAALEEIQTCRGKHFDPTLADAFCRIPHQDLLEIIGAEREGFVMPLRLLSKVA